MNTTTQATVTLSLANLTTIAALYMQYDGQCQPQPAYVHLSDDGEVTADWAAEANSQSSRIWNGQDRRYSVSPCVSATALQSFLAGPGLNLLERIHAGHTVEWDGSNYKGSLTADAAAAEEELEQALQEVDQVSVWTMSDWLWSNNNMASLWAGCSLAEAVAKIDAEIENADGLVVEGSAQAELLEKAESMFDEDGDDGLDEFHLAALVADCRITQEQANARTAA
jgi:hypothetical protein